MVSNQKKLRKLEMDDYALCGAGCIKAPLPSPEKSQIAGYIYQLEARMYMNADFNPLCIMTLLTAWLFFFDDKVDHKDGELFRDTGQFEALAQQALDYAAYTLGLKDDYEVPEGGLDDFVGLFHDVGQALRCALCEGR